jgi:PAS domain S-box-containing protein
MITNESEPNDTSRAGLRGLTPVAFPACPSSQALAEVQQLETLLVVQYRLDAMLSLAGELSSCLPYVLQTLCEIEGVDCGGVHRFDAATECLELVAHHGWSAEFVSAVSCMPAASPAAQFIRRGSICRDASADLWASRQDSLIQEGLRAVLWLPLIHQGKILGALLLASRSLDELPRLTCLAVETAAARLGQVWAHREDKQALWLLQRDLRAVFHAMSEAMWICDLQGQLRRTNRAFDQVLGYAPQELAGKTVVELCPAAVQTEVARALAEAAAGTVWSVKCPLLKKDGTRWHVECRFHRDTWDGAAALFGVAREAAVGPHAEDASRASEERLSLVIRATRDAIWDCDLAADDIWTNETFIELYGSRPRSFDESRQWWLDRIHAEDRDWVVARVNDILNSPQSQSSSLQYRFQRRDGSWATILERSCVARDPDGRPQRIFGMMQDVTAQIEAEQRLRALQSHVTDLERLAIVGELVAGIAHEVNQPLHSILNYAKACGNVLLQHQPQLDDVLAWTREIATAAQQGGTIIKRLRTFLTRPDQNLVPVFVHQMVEEALLLVSFETKSRRVAIEVDLAPPPVTVAMDRVQIEQVLVNLIKNALEAMEENAEGSRRLKISTASETDAVRISVADNGPGIALEVLPHIFEPFQTTKAGALGLGLAISRSIIQSHGGKIWATGNFESGVTFHFTLPIRPTNA